MLARKSRFHYVMELHFINFVFLVFRETRVSLRETTVLNNFSQSQPYSFRFGRVFAFIRLNYLLFDFLIFGFDTKVSSSVALLHLKADHYEETVITVSFRIST